MAKPVTEADVGVRMVMAMPEAVGIMSALNKARSLGDQKYLVDLANQLTQDADPALLVALLASLTSLVAMAGAAQSTPVSEVTQGVKDDFIRPWHAHATDQMQAAAEEQNWALVGQLAVDSQVRAHREDIAEGTNSGGFDDILRAMLQVPQNTLAVVAAEAIRRLVAQT